MHRYRHGTAGRSIGTIRSAVIHRTRPDAVAIKRQCGSPGGIVVRKLNRRRSFTVVSRRCRNIRCSNRHTSSPVQIHRRIGRGNRRRRIVLNRQRHRHTGSIIGAIAGPDIHRVAPHVRAGVGQGAAPIGVILGQLIRHGRFAVVRGARRQDQGQQGVSTTTIQTHRGIAGRSRRPCDVRDGEGRRRRCGTGVALCVLRLEIEVQATEVGTIHRQGRSERSIGCAADEVGQTARCSAVVSGRNIGVRRRDGGIAIGIEVDRCTGDAGNGRRGLIRNRNDL